MALKQGIGGMDKRREENSYNDSNKGRYARMES